MKKINYFMLFMIATLVVSFVVLSVSNNCDVETTNAVLHTLAAKTSPLAETSQVVDNTDGFKAMAAGIGIGLAALGGTIGMGLAIAKASESISRQPEADGKIRSVFMLGLVFIETVVIYALIVGILVIFVL